MHQRELIRTIDSIETPAPGAWTVAAAPVVAITWARRGRVDVPHTRAGTLTVGDRPDDVRLVLELVPRRHPSGDGRTVVLDASVVEARGDGRWTMSGDVTVDGTTVPVRFEASYHGVQRRAERAWARLTLRVELTRPGPRRPRTSIDADVLFEPPAPQRALLAA